MKEEIINLGYGEHEVDDILKVFNKKKKDIKMKAVKGFAQLYTDLRTAQKSKNFTESEKIQKQLDEACRKVLK